MINSLIITINRLCFVTPHPVGGATLWENCISLPEQNSQEFQNYLSLHKIIFPKPNVLTVENNYYILIKGSPSSSINDCMFLLCHVRVSE